MRHLRKILVLTILLLMVKVEVVGGHDVDQQYTNIGIDVHFVDESNTLLSVRSLDECKALSLNVLDGLPQEHISPLEELTFKYDLDSRRGVANSHSLEIRCDTMNDSEFAAVMVHEIGHIVDGGLLVGNSKYKSNFVDLGNPVLSNDPSVDFYNISWEDDKNRVGKSKRTNFCSTYGMTDPYEDFAECYTYYYLHNEDFKNRASKNVVLNEKYEYMRDVVFAKNSPISSDFITARIPYDVTKSDYDYDAFMDR